MSERAKQRIAGAYQHLQTALELLDKAIELEPDAGYRQDIEDVCVDVEAARLSVEILMPHQQSAS